MKVWLHHLTMIKKDSNGVILVGANHCRLDTKNLHKLCGISESLIYDLSE
ncbi:hypothetical protein CRJUMX01_120003 [Escherichia coli]|nr:hypothetical protein CRJUMX01_120003 [Escherichia coli]